MDAFEATLSKRNETKKTRSEKHRIYMQEYRKIDRETLFGSLFERMGDAYSHLDDKKNALRCYNVSEVNGYNAYLYANHGSSALGHISRKDIQ